VTPTLRKYLRRRSVHLQWPLQGDPPPRPLCAVLVIPALAESQELEETLASLCASSEKNLSRSLVICVVNNRDEEHSTVEAREDNQQSLRLLEAWQKQGRFKPLSLGWVDAASAGHALPPGEGVGLARKIGLDHGLALLNASAREVEASGGNREGQPFFLVSLDADSPGADGYVDALFRFYSNAERHGGYGAYAHRLDGDPEAAAAMVAYELYMRYHELHLRWAGSPYAWPALGSIISCTAVAYAAAGGMNRYQAGEDFYFMQQLSKTGALVPIPDARVYPSGRLSNRTPFGTGPHLREGAPRRGLYHPESYRILKEWLGLAADHEVLRPEVLTQRTEELSPALHAFLMARHFFKAWESIYAQHGRRGQLERHCHSCFDGLRTIQWIHFSRDHGLPDIPAAEAFAVLQRRCGFPESFVAGEEAVFLKRLRSWTDDRG
jgi:hypothetical protein